MNEDARTFATLDACPKCGGVFADPGETAVAMGHRHDVGDLARLGLAEQVGPSQIACPSGHGKMLVYRMKGPEGALEVDVCSSCAGVFFDAGETELLKELTARAGEVRTASGARFSAPPANANQERVVAEARATGSHGSVTGAFWQSMVQAAVDATRGIGRRRRRW
jgi:Zn-finger nucleic acid-binding protein